jgi:protein SCO1/2
VSRAAIAVLLGGALVASVPARAAEALPPELEGVGVTEHLGAALPRDVVLTDWRGRRTTVGELLAGGQPVLLTLNYYTCPMLCGLQLNGLLDALRRLDWTAGREFRIVTVSIDPRETATLADGKRQSVLGSYNRGGADWSFLVGAEPEVRRLAAAVGFGYRYDPGQRQYAHPAVAIVLSPQGTVSRYLYGIEYRPQDLKFSLMDASAGRTGSALDKLILSCFHYDAREGRYTPWAFGLMRLGGGLTLLALVLVLSVLWAHERRRRGPGPAAGAAGEAHA